MGTLEVKSLDWYPLLNKRSLYPPLAVFSLKQKIEADRKLKMEETREVHEVTSLQVDLLITKLGAYYTYSNVCVRM